MSVLNSHVSAAPSNSVAERSMSVDGGVRLSITVAPSSSSAAMVSFRIGSTIAAVEGPNVPARQTPIRAPLSAFLSRNFV